MSRVSRCNRHCTFPAQQQTGNMVEHSVVEEPVIPWGVGGDPNGAWREWKLDLRLLGGQKNDSKWMLLTLHNIWMYNVNKQLLAKTFTISTLCVTRQNPTECRFQYHFCNKQTLIQNVSYIEFYKKYFQRHFIVVGQSGADDSITYFLALSRLHLDSHIGTF